MRETILELRAQGKSYNEIVAEVGCSKSTVSYYCGEDQATKNIQRQRDRRSKIRQYLQEVKNNVPCADCGEKYPYYVMDFDHLPENGKEFNIAMFSKHKTLEDVKIEIAKCEVVCSNCHRARTWQRLLKSGESVPADLFIN